MIVFSVYYIIINIEYGDAGNPDHDRFGINQFKLTVSLGGNPLVTFVIFSL